jgi:hypothetical protein
VSGLIPDLSRWSTSSKLGGMIYHFTQKEIIKTRSYYFPCQVIVFPRKMYEIPGLRKSLQLKEGIFSGVLFTQDCDYA